VSAHEVSRLRQEQEEHIKDLQAQANKALGLEAELAKAKEAELTLQQEFVRRLAEDKKVLAAKYDAEVDELCVVQDAENKKRDLVDRRESDFEKYDAELGVWHARDCKIHAGLQGWRMLFMVRPFFRSSTFVHLRFTCRSRKGLPRLCCCCDSCGRRVPGGVPYHPPRGSQSQALHGGVDGVDQGLAPSCSCPGVTAARRCCFRTLWMGQAEPDDVDRLLLWMTLVSNRVDIWNDSAARASVEQALSSVLSCYQAINLDQLEHLREDGLSNIDRVKLRQCACAIAECANTDKLFDTGESDDDGAMDDMDFETPGFVEVSEKATKDIAGSSIPPSPNGEDFVLAAMTTDSAPLKPADAWTDP
jgi:hypothetical protein